MTSFEESRIIPTDTNLVLAKVELDGHGARRAQGDLPLVHTLVLDVGAMLMMSRFEAASQQRGPRRSDVIHADAGLGDDTGEVSAADPLVCLRRRSGLVGLAGREAGDANQ